MTTKLPTWGLFSLSDASPPALATLGHLDPAAPKLWARSFISEQPVETEATSSPAKLWEAVVLALVSAGFDTSMFSEPEVSITACRRAKSVLFLREPDALELLFAEVVVVVLNEVIACELVHGERRLLMGSRTHVSRISSSEMLRRGLIHRPQEVEPRAPTLAACVDAVGAWCDRQLLREVGSLDQLIATNESKALQLRLSSAGDRGIRLPRGTNLIAAGGRQQARAELAECAACASATVSILRADGASLALLRGYDGEIATVDREMVASLALSLRDRAVTALQVAATTATEQLLDILTLESRQTARFQAVLATAGAAVLLPGLVAALWAAGIATPVGEEPSRSVGAVAFVAGLALLGGSLARRFELDSWHTWWRRQTFRVSAVIGFLATAGAVGVMISAASSPHHKTHKVPGVDGHARHSHIN